MSAVEIRTLEELAAEIGVDHPSNIQRALFKGTDCGVVYNVLDDTAGVSVCGYAEGADAECIPHALNFPFTSDEFWAELKKADIEGCELWHEWNDDDAHD